MSFWKGKQIFKNLEIAPGGIFKGYGHVDPGGRVYYVNNITGSSGNDGLSWNQAMDEPSTAVTASEVYRQLGGRAPTVTTNDYVRNTIVMQGTATPYTALTDLGEHINFLGLGDNMLGNAAGIARLGADTGTGEYGILTTETVRGLYMFNLQFQGGATVAIAGFTNIYRSFLEYCGFFTNGSPVTTPTHGLRIIGAASGLHIKDCHWGNASGHLAGPLIGIGLEGTHFHICIVEGCHITGITSGFYCSSSTVNNWGSVVRHNYIGGQGDSVCAIGIDDDDAVGQIVYMGNWIDATTATDIEARGTLRSIGNIKYTGFIANT